MTKEQIIEQIARERRVEQIVANICKCDTPETNDLAQMVYLFLLEKPSETICGFWERGELNFLIVRMVKNNWETDHSAFRDLYTKYTRKATGLETVQNYDESKGKP